MSFDAKIFSDKLKAEKQTLKTFAAAVGVSTRTVNRWKSGESTPKAKDMDRISDVLHCAPKDFDPHFAEVGTDEVPIHARVSVASHNAYQLMHWRYDVSQREIIELAPVLFAIVAGHALKVPEQDAEIDNLAWKNGLSGATFEGQHIEKNAGIQGKCFGLLPDAPGVEQTRNLFCEAIRRLSQPISAYVDPDSLIHTEPEVVPTAAGFTPDVDLIQTLAAGDVAMEQAIVMGRIQLSKVFNTIKPSADASFLEEFVKALEETRARDIEVQRQEGIQKLENWRNFYAERHPEEAAEFDSIVAKFCFEDGAYPAHSQPNHDQRLQAWLNPWLEDWYIDAEKLTDAPRQSFLIKGQQGKGFVNVLGSPTWKRFQELKQHRSEVRKVFEESQQ
jgi:transcriptional regulator with XRE-family HTH domain